MEITETDNKKYTFKGSLCGEVSVGNKDLTEYIRECTSVNDLLVFDNLDEGEE